MKINQIYTKCLAQGAYYISNNGEAAIVDPLRDVDAYKAILEETGDQLKYIFETHYHADFVSGHYDLQRETGAKIVFGPNAKKREGVYIAQDEETLSLGNGFIKVLHTPGHTMESTSYLLIDEANTQTAIFTGDTLFIGDVGRPDLAQKASGLTQEGLASHLYHSLRNKIMTLPDDVVVYPGHGAGSACGKKMSDETSSTIGIQKKENYALRANMTEEEFISEVLDGLTTPPGYFGMNVKMNIEGYENFDQVVRGGFTALSVAALKSRSEDTILLDTRSQDNFAKGHIPMSINIGLKGDFAPWVGAVIKDVSTPIILITDEGDEKEAIVRLSRVGFDNVIGFLEGGVDTWGNSGETFSKIDRIDADAAEELVQDKQGQLEIIDVRKPGEFDGEHLEGAKSYPLSGIGGRLEELKEKEILLHCAGGYRSMIAASLMKKEGITNFKEVRGGFQALRNTELKKSDKTCQSKL